MVAESTAALAPYNGDRELHFVCQKSSKEILSCDMHSSTLLALLTFQVFTQIPLQVKGRDAFYRCTIQIKTRQCFGLSSPLTQKSAWVFVLNIGLDRALRVGPPSGNPVIPKSRDPGGFQPPEIPGWRLRDPEPQFFQKKLSFGSIFCRKSDKKVPFNLFVLDNLLLYLDYTIAM